MRDDVLTQMRDHRSIRKFKPAPLADELVAECVAAAQCAATSSNVQGYAVLQIKDPSVREELASLTGGQPQVAEAGAFFVLCADERRHRMLAEQHDQPYEGNLESFLIDTIDASLFAQNLCLAFEARDLGTCFIGGLRNDLPRLRELVRVPQGVFPLFGLCAGEPLEREETKPRLAPESVLFVDSFPTDEKLREQIAEYDERMASYYAARGLKGRNWSGGVARKFKQPQRPGLLAFFSEQGARFR